MKKIIAVILALTFAFSSLTAFAFNSEEAEKKADFLKALELFKGTDKGYELDKSLTRLEALIMLIRLSGNEMNALYPEEEYEHPFTDAPEWEGAESYMAYAYANKIVNGIANRKITLINTRNIIKAVIISTLRIAVIANTTEKVIYVHTSQIKWSERNTFIISVFKLKLSVSARYARLSSPSGYLFLTV